MGDVTDRTAVRALGRDVAPDQVRRAPRDTVAARGVVWLPRRRSAGLPSTSWSDVAEQQKWSPGRVGSPDQRWTVVDLGEARRAGGPGMDGEQKLSKRLLSTAK